MASPLQPEAPPAATVAERRGGVAAAIEAVAVVAIALAVSSWIYVSRGASA